MNSSKQNPAPAETHIYCATRQEWRAWLEKNHDKEIRISLLKYKKHTGKPSLGHLESMEEAICFGWIDTTIKRLDEDRYVRRFARRNSKSKWSRNTLSYAKRLIAEGRMTPAGMKFYLEGLKRPVHDHDIPKNPEMPKDLKAAFSKNKKARLNFDAFPPSVRRLFLRWIESAKRTETRLKRIREVVQRAVEKRKQVI